jgi:hypothetical protein
VWSRTQYRRKRPLAERSGVDRSGHATESRAPALLSSLRPVGAWALVVAEKPKDDTYSGVGQAGTAGGSFCVSRARVNPQQRHVRVRRNRVKFDRTAPGVLRREIREGAPPKLRQRLGVQTISRSGSQIELVAPYTHGLALTLLAAGARSRQGTSGITPSLVLLFLKTAESAPRGRRRSRPGRAPRRLSPCREEYDLLTPRCPRSRRTFTHPPAGSSRPVKRIHASHLGHEA